MTFYKQQISLTSGVRQVRVIKISGMDSAPSGGTHCLERPAKEKTSDQHFAAGDISPWINSTYYSAAHKMNLLSIKRSDARISGCRDKVSCHGRNVCRIEIDA